MKTIFCDIDGVILHHPEDYIPVVKGTHSVAVGRAAKKLFEWHKKGYKVILVTGRPELMRECTEENLQTLGMMYDHLIMGLGPGPRVLINDIDPDEPDVEKAMGINLVRNGGIDELEL